MLKCVCSVTMEAQAMPQAPVVYVVNVKSKGKTHRVISPCTPPAANRAPPQRVHCGWRIKKSTSLVFYSEQIKWTSLCKKCFPHGLYLPAPREDEEEPIEDE